MDRKDRKRRGNGEKEGNKGKGGKEKEINGETMKKG